MKIDKTYVTKLINEEYEQIVMNELFSKRSASLEDIMDGDKNPNTDEVIKSDHFQKSLFEDLFRDKKKFTDWKLDKKKGSVDDVMHNQDETFPVSYEFSFNYKYKDTIIPRLKLLITGHVNVKWSSGYHSQSSNKAAEYADVDSDHLGDDLELKLYADNNEIPLRRLDGKDWMTPTLKRNIAKAVLSPYL